MTNNAVLTSEAASPSPALELSPASIHAELEKILTSATFIRSKRLGKFLQFTVDQYLEGRQAALKEYLVGVEVFNKLESFDPRIDSIVRVEARRLRSKLERYYKTEGRNDEIVIQFRKGSYVPIVITRDQLPAGCGYSAEESNGSARLVSIAPLNNLSADPVHQYFCYGIAEDLKTALTKLNGLRVVARNENNAPEHTSEEFKADYTLEGSVRRQGERLRITMQLVDNHGGYYVWSDTFEKDISDAFAVQDEISSVVATALKQVLPH